MALAATFLVGAKTRLLPPSLPFRFFAAAALFHILMWVTLFVGAADVTGFRGGLGRPLAAVHLATLGMLTMTAIGAAVQLLPVATRRALVAVWPIKLTFWLAVPGLVLLVGGMEHLHPPVMLAGALSATAGLMLFAWLLADNLRRAGGLPVVSAFGWAALAALVGVVGLGLALELDYHRAFLPDHASVALAHMILGGYGFMGLLALGFSHVLVPMFALSSAPAKRPAFAGFALAGGAVALGTFGALADSRAASAAAALTGLAAAGMHLWLMQRALATGMRKRLGLSFVLVRAAWAMLPLSLVVGLASLYGVAGPNGPTLFGLTLIGGWLVTFLLGILQRILPFLASMHATSSGGMPPLMSELAAGGPLKLHAVCHGLALCILAAAIVMDDPVLVRAGAAVGFVGALAFARFTAEVLHRVFRRGAA